ncbi:MAG: polymer-forming cytoskeletal protein [Chlorobi bacterium]|nr:polymer-forming cytoskeletal protein [Chlorobiota bacterium]
MALIKESRSAEDVSILSRGIKIEGKFISSGDVRLDGVVVGNVNVNGNLTLGETAKIQGDVNAKNVIVSGTIEGSVKASEKIVLESKSRLKGDLVAKILLVEEGAKFDGKSMMSPQPPPVLPQTK